MTGSRIGLHQADQDTFDGPGLRVGGAGLMVGRNRQRLPVALRLFRPEPTQMLMVGGVRCAQLLAFRALALGARLFIKTAREQEWDTFLRRSSVGRETATFLPAGASPPTAGTLAQPHLVIVDVGPTMGPEPGRRSPWQATLIVREDLAAWDVNLLQQSDMVVLQRLSEVESSVAASALGLAEALDWLSRIHPEMVALVSRARLQWVLLGPTATEQGLLGSIARA